MVLPSRVTAVMAFAESHVASRIGISSYLVIFNEPINGI
ncbi:MAG: hypothetical protein BWX89_00785 [candidate division TA06 bacterium ADurb.Bin131]|uniref:Uncharacterized protein n=1 Tax=candidate division TA06 bacterium ADurb.Bin131 TaxID=1852827 RepID=A0A1V6CA43_UNCT6|nr:MAG: hypothetical protein BWX89_00785 [candidate division TA06 bacterium ADurb.Bin131]